MTSTSQTAAPADVRVPRKTKARNAALDCTRTFLTLVVVLHHAVIPYTYFGHTDPKSWIGFDMIVLATDSFFMAMFFFLSGLFVAIALQDNDGRLQLFSSQCDSKMSARRTPATSPLSYA